MRKSDLFFNVLRLPVDFFMLIGAGIATYFLRTELFSAFRPVLFEFSLPFLKFFYLVVLVSVIFIITYVLSGLYSMKVRMRMFEEFARILLASSAGILTVIIYIFLRQELFDSRFLVLGGWFFAVLFVCFGRLAVRYVQAVAVAKYGFGAHKILVVGNDEAASIMVAEISKDPSLGYCAVEKLDSKDISKIMLSIDRLKADEVLLTQYDYSSDLVSELLSFCQEHHILFKLIPTGSQILTTNFDVDIFKGLPIIEIKRTNLDGWGRVIKRVIDVFGSLFGLIVLSPLLAFLALAIKWETEGSIFVKLKRVSGNREFDLYKFRSMIDNAHELNLYMRSIGNDRPDAGPLWKMKNDPRITKVGRFIRKTRIDELPQLWNVVKGEMSVVGPRPHQSNEIERYERHHKKVLAIKAGATGLAQVSGSSDLDFEKEVALDSFYIDNWSFWLDVKIILKTVLKMFFDRSAV